MILGVDARELQGRPTGTGRYLRNLLRAWSRLSPAGSAERGASAGRTGDGAIQRIVAYFNGPAPADPVLEAAPIEVRAIGDKPVRGLWWQDRRLPAAARADGIEVFFSPAYTCPLRLDLPRVTAVHDMSFFSMPEDFGVLDGMRRRATVAASIAASARIVTISDFTRREIAAYFPPAASRVVHVPLGADDDLPPPPPRDEARRRLGLRGPLVLTVGSVFNRRRLPVLLRAFAALVRRWPHARLDVVGENRTTPPIDFAAVARGLGIEDRVRLSGYVSEPALADRYAAADAAVFLSEYEGFGLPVLEAMCRGVPVVASGKPAVGEVFGDAALLVDPQDVYAVRDALDAVLSDRHLRNDLVRRGLGLAARFSWDETARRTRDVLTAACGR